MNPPKNVIIVGAGPVGLYAALALLEQGHKVWVIEEAPQCGGLLRSFSNKDGVVFDIGSHFLRQTGIPEIDALLYSVLDELPHLWQRLPYLKGGTYWRGKLYEKSSFPNLHHLPRDLYDKAVEEILHCHPSPLESSQNEFEHLTKNYGSTLVKELYAPTLKKFLGVPLTELWPGASCSYALDRVLAFTPQLSREIKKTPEMDSRFGFHFSDEGQSGIVNYYPSTGGIGQWIDLLVSQIQRRGGKILTQTRVEKATREGKEVRSVALSSGETLACDALIWSVVPFPLLRAVGIPVAPQHFKIRTANLFYFVFDKPLEAECYYFTCLDPDYSVFRVSLYNNLRSRPEDRTRYALCAEVLADTALNEAALMPQLISEFRKMGLLPKEAQCLYQHASHERAGFPVETAGMRATLRQVHDTVASELTNVALIGRGAGRQFFTQNTLTDAYLELTRLGYLPKTKIMPNRE